MKENNFKKNPSSENESGRSSLAPTVLLERYRHLLKKQTATLLLNRALSFLIIGFVAVSTRLSIIQVLAAIIVSAAVTTLWLYERRVESSQAQTLADDLAQYSGKEALDLYIRSGYNVDRKASARPVLSLALYEPQLWLILTIAFTLVQTVFGPLH